MSVETLAVVLHHSNARGTDKVVLIGIANHDGDGGAWPSITTLARYAGVDERSVQRALRRLEASGELRIHYRAGGTQHTRGDHRPNRYDILVTCPTNCAGGRQHLTVQPDEPPHNEVTPTSPRNRDEVTPASPRDGERGDASDANEVTPTSPEPSLNHPVVPTSSKVASQPERTSLTHKVGSTLIDVSPGPEPRADVEEVCQALVEAMVANGWKRPTISARWRTQARLMLDRDGRTLEEALGAIRWSASDEFWCSVIRSTTKLREHFDQMRIRARHQANGRGDRLAPIARGVANRRRDGQSVFAQQTAIGGAG